MTSKITPQAPTPPKPLAQRVDLPSGEKIDSQIRPRLGSIQRVDSIPENVLEARLKARGLTNEVLDDIGHYDDKKT